MLMMHRNILDADFIGKRGYHPDDVGYTCSLIEIGLIDQEGNRL